MKDRLFSLIFGATILATNPTFASDQETGAERVAGRGALSVLNDDCTINIATKLTYKGVLQLSSTSNSMMRFCSTPCIWESMAQQERIKLTPFLGTIMDQFKNAFCVFFDSNQQYPITIAKLMSFKGNPIQHPKFSGVCEFSIANRKFLLQNCQSGPDRLELLDPAATATFSWHEAASGDHYPSGFTAGVKICTNPVRVAGLHFNTPEYADIAHNSVMTGEVVSNYFQIFPLTITASEELNK
jgi:hypothetical protein